MRKFTILIACLLILGLQAAWAQTEVKGKVTDKEGGSLPGVSVIVKGTLVGTVTDIDGKYVLSVPSGYNELIFSFVGMITQELKIDGRAIIDIQMEEDVVGLDEVVVTALGISREKRTLGYATQDVGGEQLQQTGNTNFVSALTGRVAGVQVTSASGTMGGSSKILIRGASSITSNNNPLYVVDGVVIDNSDYNSANTARGGGGYDYGSMAQDLNLEDIENVQVLKGPSATALYGSRAANGVILITTKKGKITGKKGIGVQLNLGITGESVAYMPNYQKEYGGGTIYEGEDAVKGFQPVEIDGQTYLVHDYGTDESWGPKYDPNTKVLMWNAFDPFDVGDDNTQVPNPYYMNPQPWVYPENDVKAMFNTGVLYSTNIALTGGTDAASFRLSYTNQNGTGYFPNTRMAKNAINFNGDARLSSKLMGFANVNYIQSSYNGRVETGYGDNNPMVRINQWGQLQLDFEQLKSYINPDGSQRTWNRYAWDNPAPVYSNNHYWSRYKDFQNDVRDHYFGNVGLRYNILDWLSAQVRANMDFYEFNIYERIAVNSTFMSSYIENWRSNSEFNLEGLLMADKDLSEDFNLNVTLGVNQMTRKYDNIIGQTNGGLVVADVYNLSNSTDPATVTNTWNKKRINSLFGSVTLDYKSMASLIVTGRNDWSSTLPEDKLSYFYPSVSGSFVFTELEPLKDNKYFSFGKLRLSWAQVGNDTDPYRLGYVYQAMDNFGSNPNYRLSLRLNNPNLEPEKTIGWEVGADLKFFLNRLGLDITYYDMYTVNQIIAVATSAASGYTSQMINAGKMTNKGWEIQLYATPLKLDNGFEWDLSLNFAANKNEVVELDEGVDSYLLGSLFGVEVHAEVGKPYGSIKGYNYVFDSQGNKVIGTNGRFLNGPIESVGSVMPDFTLGFLNTFRYKGIDLSVLFDWQNGGYLFSLTNMWGMYSGILEETAGTNANGVDYRADVADGGGFLNEGVYGYVDAETGDVVWTDAEGNPSEVPVQNTTYLNALTWAADHYSRARAGQNTFKSDYIKLRELKLGYTFNTKEWGPITGMTVSAFGRNLAILLRDNKHIDPESTTSPGNVQGIEGGQLPSTRLYGLSVSLNF